MNADNSLKLRKATRADAELLLAWRNEPATRANSLNSEPISLETHLSWLDRTLLRDDCRLMVAELDGKPVGTVREDDLVDSTELSWTIAPEMRGKGIGKKMVKAASENAKSARILAKIKSSNAPSEAIVKSLGFAFSKEVEGVGYWTLEKGTAGTTK